MRSEGFSFNLLSLSGIVVFFLGGALDEKAFQQKG